MRVTFPSTTVCTTKVLELHLEPARDTAPGQASTGEDVVPLGDQLERLVADVLEHALEPASSGARPRARDRCPARPTRPEG